MHALIAQEMSVNQMLNRLHCLSRLLKHNVETAYKQHGSHPQVRFLSPTVCFLSDVAGHEHLQRRDES